MDAINFAVENGGNVAVIITMVLQILQLWFDTPHNALQQGEEMVMAERKREFRRRRILVHRLVRRLQRRRVFRSCGSVPHLLLPTTGHYWDEAVPLFTPRQFVEKFRLGKTTFDILVAALHDRLRKQDTNMKRSIPVAKRVAICLSVLKSNASSDLVADLFGVGRSTVPFLLVEFCNAVNEILYPRYVNYPQTHDAKVAIAQGFMNRWQFPGCFGSLDGTHIPILAPKEYYLDYFNYKKFYSIVLLALVDHKYKFLYTNIGRPGRVNDATIFADSGLRTELQNNVPDRDLHIIGDGAFPLSLYLMKPFPIVHNMLEARRHFNERLSRARVVVEDAFGRLKGRWRIIMKRGDFSLENTKKIVKTCVVLHNMCEEHNDKFYQEWENDVAEFDANFVQPRQPLIHDNQRAPAEKRDRIMQELFADDIILAGP